MTSDLRWAAAQGEVAVGRGRALTRAARWGITAATFLIFAVPPLRAQTESVLYSFAGPPADGGSPAGSLVRDANGNFYGTTQNGGAANAGTVFKLHPKGDGTYTESVLYSFGATSDDGQLPGGLVIDGSGNLYGTTQAGGGSSACQFGCGTVFELAEASGVYTETILHNFTGDPDGQSPGSLSMDASGNLYGTTEFGGTAKSPSFCKAGCGTVFELTNNSGSYTYSVLFSFSIAGLYGITPAGNVVVDSSGNVFGTAPAGGGSSACALGCGTVFELVNSSGSYAPKALYSFTGVPDGEIPGSNLILDAQGNLYGTASGGVSTACSSFGCGAVFKLHPNGGGSYAESVLYSFTGSPDGQGPGNLEVDASGDFYGITGAGGASTACIGCGTVFKLHSNGDGSYTESVLYSFTGSPDGAVPTGLVLDATDNVFGVTGLGGTSTVCSISGCGTVFEITAGSTGATDTISAASGSGQTATVDENFSAPLMAAVVNGSGAGVSGVTVAFTAPSSGAGGTFAGGVNTAVTNASGIATSAVFTANGTAGSYAVTATAPNVSGTATFTLTNAAVQTATTITVSTSSSDHGTALPSNDALVGNPVTVSFKVAQTSGSATPTGNVVVSDGVGDTCTPSPVILTAASAGAGSCTLTIASLPASGNATLTATFTPSSNAFSGSTGSATESVVEISACGPSVPEQIVKQGAMITYSFTVCVAGNANAVAPVANVVDCVPRGKCTLGITQMGQTGVYTVSVTIVTDCGDCKTLVVPQPRSWPRSWPGSWLLTLFYICALLALLMAGQFARRSRARTWLVYIASFLFVIALGGMSACSGSSNDTPVGTYTVSVQAVAGNFNVVVPANVMVEK